MFPREHFFDVGHGIRTPSSSLRCCYRAVALITEILRVRSAAAFPLVSVGRKLVCVAREDGGTIPALEKFTDEASAAIGDVRASGLCACRLCTYCRPRIEKWGKKRTAFGVVPAHRRGRGGHGWGGHGLGRGGHYPEKYGTTVPEKSTVLSAEEAKEWLGLNPRRAF